MYPNVFSCSLPYSIPEIERVYVSLLVNIAIQVRRILFPSLYRSESMCTNSRALAILKCSRWNVVFLGT